MKLTELRIPFAIEIRTNASYEHDKRILGKSTVRFAIGSVSKSKACDLSLPLSIFLHIPRYCRGQNLSKKKESCTSRKRSSIIDPPLYTRKENFSFVQEGELERFQVKITGLSLRNLFLSPNSSLPPHIRPLTLEGFSKFRFKAVPMKNPRIRTVPRYLAYKTFPSVLGRKRAIFASLSSSSSLRSSLLLFKTSLFFFLSQSGQIDRL